MSRAEPSLPMQDVNAFATLLRQHRQYRRVSQLDLALSCDISARHLSYLETGRARPSREMVLHLSEGLFLTLPARNGLLAAAGFAPAYPVTPLKAEVLKPFRAVLEEMMTRHSPYPALLCDRHWTLRDANQTARTLLAPLIGAHAEMNLIRMVTGSQQARTLIGNYAEMLHELRGRISLEAQEAPGDPVLADLLATLAAACRHHPLKDQLVRRPLLPLILNAPGGRLAFLSAIAHFGTNEDVTIRDLRLELLFPADEATRAALNASS